MLCSVKLITLDVSEIGRQRATFKQALCIPRKRDDEPEYPELTSGKRSGSSPAFAEQEGGSGTYGGFGRRLRTPS